MRLQVIVENQRPVEIPLSHQDLLTGVIYALLKTSSADYSRFLHDDGYAADDGPNRFKLFAFSGLRARSRQVVGDRLRIGPGPVEWFISSPIADFLTHCATGLLSEGQLRVGTAHFPITTIQALPAPEFTAGHGEFVCLTPIVADRNRPAELNRPAEYLRPADAAAFSEVVNHNLVRKHQAVHGRPPAGEPVRLEFNQEYLARSRGGTKKITFKNIDVVGALAPFIATGDPALLQVGYECGFGSKNSAGFGMVEVEQKGRRG